MTNYSEELRSQTDALHTPEHNESHMHAKQHSFLEVYLIPEDKSVSYYAKYYVSYHAKIMFHITPNISRGFLDSPS